MCKLQRSMLLCRLYDPDEVRAMLNRENPDGKSAGTFSNYTSLAILPFAPANRYRPEEIPFTSRTWDARIEVVAEVVSVAEAEGKQAGEVKPLIASIPK